MDEAFLAQQERQLALIAFLDEMDSLFGPPTDEQMAATDALLDEMWETFDASAGSRRAGPSTAAPSMPTT